MQSTMADYIEKNSASIKITAGDFLKCKGQTLEDYLDFIRVVAHKGHKLSVHLLACMTNLKVVVITKTRFWSTVIDCDVFSVDIVLVYLGKSTFRDTVPIPTKPTLILVNDQVNEHNVPEVPQVIDPNRRFTRWVMSRPPTLPQI